MARGLSADLNIMRHALFVCVHNSARSQMAEAFFNRLSGGRIKAISAGTMPTEQVDPQTVQVMREVGIGIGSQKPKPLTREMTDQVARIITMGCGVEGVCPATFVETEDWDLEDPKGQPLEKVREIRDQIRGKVSGLVEEMRGS